MIPLLVIIARYTQKNILKIWPKKVGNASVAVAKDFERVTLGLDRYKEATVLQRLEIWIF